MNTKIEIKSYDDDYTIRLEEVDSPTGLVRIEIFDSHGDMHSTPCNFSVKQLRHALRKIAI